MPGVTIDQSLVDKIIDYEKDLVFYLLMYVFGGKGVNVVEKVFSKKPDPSTPSVESTQS